EVVRHESELAPYRPAVDTRMKAGGVRPRVDHLDLLAVDAGTHERPLDGLADRDDGRDAPGRVAEALKAIERKTDAAVEDQHRNPHEQPGHQREDRKSTRLNSSHDQI